MTYKVILQKVGCWLLIGVIMFGTIIDTYWALDNQQQYHIIENASGI
jgi:hypothetical protein